MEYISTKEMYELELNSEYYGVSTFELMKNAGMALADEIQKKEKIESSKISVLCGSGNNAGDAYVAAEILAQNGADVTVYVLCEAKKRKVKKHFLKLKTA